MKIEKLFASIAMLGLTATAACGDATNAPPGSGAPGGDPNASSSGANNSSGNNSSGATSSGAPDLNAAPGAACPPRTNATQAIHVTMAVTWAGSVGKNPGSGNVHVW